MHLTQSDYVRRMRRWDRNNQVATIDLITRCADVSWTIPKLESSLQTEQPTEKTGTFGLRLRRYGIELVLDLYRIIYVGRCGAFLDVPNGIDLSPFNAERFGVSRQHLVIVHEDDATFVVDTHSKHGTYLNGAKLLPHQPYRLKDQDRLRLGGLDCTMQFA